MGPMPIPSVPAIAYRRKETPKQKASMMRSRSKSMGGRTRDEPHDHIPPAPAPPRFSLPAADDKYMLSIFLGDNSNFNIEASSSSSTAPDTITVPTPRKLQVPKVPQITVQRREQILQNTAMPIASIHGATSYADGVRSSTTPIKRRTFVPSPPPLTKPHLAEKGRNLSEHSTWAASIQ